MKELTDSGVLEMLDTQYPDLLLDYVQLADDTPYAGCASHKNAVIAAIAALDKRVRVGNSLKHPPLTVESDKMAGKPYPTDMFFAVLRSDEEHPVRDLCRMLYWDAFAFEPYPTYGRAEFQQINAVLFPPHARDTLEIYCWNDDFSNYFDDGKYWWGTAMWSVWDPVYQRFTVIGASLID